MSAEPKPLPSTEDVVRYMEYWRDQIPAEGQSVSFNAIAADYLADKQAMFRAYNATGGIGHSLMYKTPEEAINEIKAKMNPFDPKAEAECLRSQAQALLGLADEMERRNS